MRILVTGADGFVGRGLVEALAGQGHQLLLTDRKAGERAGDGSSCVWMPGDLADPAHVERLTQEPLDLVYHLASVPGALAETQPDLGRAANLLAPEALFHRLAAQARPPRVVFASSVAVYGALGPAPMDEDCATAPGLSYGAHKLMAEILLADHARRGSLDPVSLRLPGIVARPPAETGHGSAFMSQLFHKAAAGAPYACPVSAEATCWWMSRKACVANLLHAGLVPASRLPLDRVVQLPVLQASVGAVIAALARRFGAEAVAGIRHAPDARIEALFGRQPELATPRARAAGFTVDADLDSLVENALPAGWAG